MSANLSNSILSIFIPSYPTFSSLMVDEDVSTQMFVRETIHRAVAIPGPYRPPTLADRAGGSFRTWS